MNPQRQSYSSFPIVGVPIRNISDYSPFGVQLDGRTVSLDNYRYGFQNQEEDSETGLVNYKYRMHDPRVGRFFAVDPLGFNFPWNSSYAFSENRLLAGIELEGLQHVSYNGTMYNYTGKSDSRIELTLGWQESVHKGHISLERVKKWKDDWYVTIEDQRNYWGKSTGTTISFYNNYNDYKANKPFKVITERTIMQSLYSSSRELDGPENAPFVKGETNFNGSTTYGPVTIKGNVKLKEINSYENPSFELENTLEVSYDWNPLNWKIIPESSLSLDVNLYTKNATKDNEVKFETGLEFNFKVFKFGETSDSNGEEKLTFGIQTNSSPTLDVKIIANTIYEKKIK